MLTTKLKSFDTLFNIATKSISITLSLTGIGLIVIPMSTGIPCGLTSSKNVLCEIVCRSIIGTIKNIRKINKLLNLLIRYTKEVYKDFWLLKVNINLYVVFSVSTLMRQKKPFFKQEHKSKKSFFLLIVN